MPKRIILASACSLVLTALGLAAAACGGSIVGSGELVTETYAFTNYTRIEASQVFDVEISRGDAFSLEVTVDDNLVDQLRVEQDGDTVRIGLDSGINLGVTTRRAVVVLPELEAFKLSGASSGRVRGFDSKTDLAVVLSGASSLDLGDVAFGGASLDISGASKVTGQLLASDVRFVASGASQIVVGGIGDNADLEASGASKLGLGVFRLQSAGVALSGASNAKVNVSSTLDADLSGASTLEYSGSAVIRDIKTSGASQIKRSGP